MNKRDHRGELVGRSERPRATGFWHSAGRNLACFAWMTGALMANATAQNPNRVGDLDASANVEQSLGGTYSSSYGSLGSVELVAPNIYAITLNHTGTDWSERFLMGIPPGYPQNAPSLVLFHGYGEVPDDLMTKTDFFAEAMARGWYVIAPLGAHQFNYSIDYAQENVEVALGWCSQYLSMDMDRIYGVGFSMGGGMATSYAARHQNPYRAQFAAVINHTGTTSVRDVFWTGSDKSLMMGPLMFGGTPNQQSFAYQRASTIDLDLIGVVDQEADMVRNLVSTPVQVFTAQFDPISYLVNQSVTFDQQKVLRGGASDLHFVAASTHSWSTLDEKTALDWLEPHTLQERAPNLTHRLLADKTGRWDRFYLTQRQTGKFTPLTWFAQTSLNRLYLVGIENLSRILIEPDSLGLDISQPFEIRYQSADPQIAFLLISGLDAPPTEVRRNGVLITNWNWHAAKKRLILRETQPKTTPSWVVTP